MTIGKSRGCGRLVTNDTEYFTESHVCGVGKGKGDLSGDCREISIGGLGKTVWAISAC